MSDLTTLDFQASLDIQTSEHGSNLRRNADNYRFLRVGHAATAAPTLFRRTADRLACQVSRWRYRMLVSVGIVPLAEPCS